MQGNGLSSLYFEMFIILIVVGFSLVVVAREGGVGGRGHPHFCENLPSKQMLPMGYP